MTDILFTPIRLNELEILIQNSVEKAIRNYPIQKESPDPNSWLSLDDLISYDPAKRTKATWYSLVSRGEVPYHKKGKNLFFLKSEINEWLMSGRRKTNAEIATEADKYLKKKGGKK